VLGAVWGGGGGDGAGGGCAKGSEEGRETNSERRGRNPKVVGHLARMCFVKGPKILTDKITHTNTNTHTMS
jgi:hypothetical protein